MALVTCQLAGSDPNYIIGNNLFSWGQLCLIRKSVTVIYPRVYLGTIVVHPVHERPSIASGKY